MLESRDRAPARRDWRGLEELRPALMSWLAGRCRDESEAEDVIQETFMRAARYRGSLVEPGRLQAWTQRIARNVLTDLVRRECRLRRATAGEQPLDELECRESRESRESEEQDPDLRCGNWIVERGQALGTMAGAFAEMRDDDRQVLGSFYWGGESCHETAAECGIPRELVKVRLFRARRRLLRVLHRRFALGSGRPAPPEEPEAAGEAP